VEGWLQTRNWEDKDGNKRYTTEVVVDNLILLGSGRGASEGPPSTDEEYVSQGPAGLAAGRLAAPSTEVDQKNRSRH